MKRIHIFLLTLSFVFCLQNHYVSAEEVVVGDAWYLSPQTLEHHESSMIGQGPLFQVNYKVDDVLTDEIVTIIKEIHHQVNSFRVENGKDPLKLDPIICVPCQQHSVNMAAGEIPLSHEGVYDRIRMIMKFIPNLRNFGENCAYVWNYNDPARMAVYGWITSPGHRKNMLGNFNLTGLGVAKNDKGEYYFTQIFIKTKE